MSSSENKTVNNSPQPTVSSWQAAQFILKDYLKHSPGSLLVLLVFVLSHVARTVMMYVISIILDDVTTGEHSQSGALALTGLAAGVYVFREILRFAGDLKLLEYEARQSERMSLWAQKVILGKSLGFHNDRFAGTTATKIDKLADKSIELHDIIHYSILPLAVSVAGAFVVVARFNFIAALIGLGSLILYVITVLPVVKKRVKMVQERTRLFSEQRGRLIDSISNVAAVKAFSGAKQEQKEYKDYVNKSYAKLKETWRYQTLFINPLSAVFYVLIVFLPIVWLIFVADESGANVAELFLTVMLFRDVGRRLWDIANSWRRLEVTLEEIAEGLEILQTDPGVVDIANAQELVVETADISFNQVGFQYDNLTVFEDLKLNIPNGQTVGLVGSSGGGKSTLVKLVMRFMDVDSGVIAIGGHDISKVDQDSLRANIGYIPQEPILFHRSLFENIAYGRPSASKAEVLAAAKEAHAHEFIRSLPNGYDTLVGERGVKLSGGQRQRVAIARIILKNAPVLILDEATSALDSESEHFIQESFIELMQNRTTIVIAHRLSTIHHLDRILVLEGGKIVQDGPHEELIKQKGVYKKLWGHQSGGFLTEE